MCVHPIRLTTSAPGERVPCGFCIECRSRYRRGWAIRCLHEASLHDENMYLTLTYADEFLPEHGSLVPEHFQKFMRRLRKSLAPKKVRFYHAGEYGDVNFRPHYHALIFGHMPCELYDLPPSGAFPLFRAPEIERLWPYGWSSVGAVTFASANYVAGYVLKKVDKVGKKKKYSVDPETGETHEIEPEYSTMSRGGRVGRGLGAGWFDKYGEEVSRLETVVIDGQEMMPPRYYDNLLRERDVAAWEVMKLRRLRKNRKSGPDDRPIDVIREEKREAMAREVIARKRLEDIDRRL